MIILEGSFTSDVCIGFGELNPYEYRSTIYGARMTLHNGVKALVF